MKWETTQTFLILDLNSRKVEKVGDLTYVSLEGGGSYGWDWIDSPGETP
jgi:hypothetical protein